ncbi:hypothetical protein AWH62_15375 [Maricaulis sp. W15]|uniref:hypothetical protein n=1 Tax=Maricaulis sp. W15 TaxID=1772333 RepID=UPI000948D0A5|nr:hypothetical protein [Maricaulis sp. W15]OLF80609.1 hypothetical protein AWH62_15375 [Maricaulis sp. W15]
MRIFLQCAAERPAIPLSGKAFRRVQNLFFAIAKVMPGPDQGRLAGLMTARAALPGQAPCLIPQTGGACQERI